MERNRQKLWLIQQEIVAAVNDNVPPRVEKSAKFNQYGLTRALESLVNEIERSVILGKIPEMSHLATSSRNYLTKLLMNIESSMLKILTELSDQTFTPYENNSRSGQVHQSDHLSGFYVF